MTDLMFGPLTLGRSVQLVAKIMANLARVFSVVFGLVWVCTCLQMCTLRASRILPSGIAQNFINKSLWRAVTDTLHVIQASWLVPSSLEGVVICRPFSVPFLMSCYF